MAEAFKLFLDLYHVLHNFITSLGMHEEAQRHGISELHQLVKALREIVISLKDGQLIEEQVGVSESRTRSVHECCILRFEETLLYHFLQRRLRCRNHRLNNTELP